ncbi:MAG: ribokinase [Actinomycetota bacterium]|nr:ribokinase [Actinomycetota bacterium]
MSANNGHVTVVGSINRDLVLSCRTLPERGESIAATGFETHNGGKGANQAVALARLRNSVAMVGSVGTDSDGDLLIDALVSEGIDVVGVTRSNESTGLAVILVDNAGDNMIVTNQGANAALTVGDIDRTSETIRTADVTLVQMEIPLEVVAAAVAAAAGTTILNPAPAEPLGPLVLDHVDYLVPNRTELGTLAGVATPETEAEVLAAARNLGFAGTVVVTLGSHGAVAIIEGVIKARTKPPLVAVIDTVGAGDAFCAGFADALAGNASLPDAMAWGTACGAYATTVRGAQPSMPSRADALSLLPTVLILGTRE